MRMAYRRTRTRLRDGLRIEGAVANDVTAEAKAEDAALSYRVYSLADLEAREATLRQSMIAPAPPPTWRDPWRAAGALVHAFRTWRRSPWPREPMKAALRAPALVFATELESLARATDWKKVGVRAGFAAGGALALLGVVLAAAAASDDLQPARRAARTEVANALAAPVDAAPPPPVTPPPRKAVSRVVTSEPEIFIP